MNGNEDLSIAELAERAARARARLKEDVEALAYKVSPENLELEAKEVAQHVVDEAKTAVVQLRADVVTLARRYPLVTAATLGFGGMLYAAVVRRDGRLLVGALSCGALAFKLGRDARRRHQQRKLLLANAALPGRTV